MKLSGGLVLSIRALVLFSATLSLATPANAQATSESAAGVSTSNALSATHSAPNIDKANFALTSRATSLNSKTAELGISLRRANNIEGQGEESQFRARLGIGGGVDVFVLANRGVTGTKWKPGVGALWQFAGRNGEPLSMAVATQFRKGAFAEPNGEGEIDLEWIGTYRANLNELSMNVLAGADLDGETQVIETRIAGVRRFGRSLKAGIEGEFRSSRRTSATDAGDESGDPSPPLLGNVQTVFAGPMIQYGVSALTLTAAAGYSSFRQSNPGPSESNSGAQGVVRLNYGF